MMGMNRGGGGPQQGTAAERAQGFAGRFRAQQANQPGGGGIADRFRQQQAAQGRMARPMGPPPGRGGPMAPPPNRGGMGAGRMQQQQMMAQQMRRGGRPIQPPNPGGGRAPMRPTMGPGGRRNY